MNNDMYFAVRPTEEIGKYLEDKLLIYKKFLRDSGLLDELRKSYRLFYGSTAIQEFDDGKTTMKVNHYGSLIRGIHTSVTSQRPAFQAMAINTDHKSQAETQLAAGLCDYYMRSKRLEEKLKSATEYALFLREGYITADWDVFGGNAYAVNPDTNKAVYEGDVLFEAHSITSVCRNVQNYGEQDWYIITRQKNKWDLVAKYPELKDKILAVKVSKGRLSESLDLSYQISVDQSDNDIIDVHTFIHRKTEAVPNGRMVSFVAYDAVMFDGPLPYDRPYVFQISSAKAFQTAFGHCSQMDLMPLQDALDMVFSIVLTNMNAFGVQNLMSPKGNGVSFSKLTEGLNLIEYDAKMGPPQPLNLLQTPAEVFNFATMIISNQETISGQNAIARGNVPPTMSGTAMALVANQALQFNSGVQHSYNMLLEDVGTALIELLKTFAKAPRIAQIAGKSKRSLMKSFKDEDLLKVGRVTVDAANSMSKTAAGKLELANNLLNSGLIKTPEQYISVFSTGNLEPLYEHDQAQLSLIRLENEWLGEGKPVQVIMTDDHSLHALEHSCILNSPESRENPQIVSNALMHIQQHVDFGKTIDPVLAQMLRFAPLQMPPPEMAPPPQEVTETTNTITDQAQEIAPPNMPKIAGTSETFNPQGASF